MKLAAIIPARYASTRLPGKPLVDILGKSMIQRVYEQVQKTPGIDKVMVATDDARIYRHVLDDFKGEALMTSSAHTSGTDRCAEACAQLPEDYTWIINVQGDEPLIDPRQLEQLADTLKKQQADIATLVKQIEKTQTLFDPNSPKVVLDNQQRALYFSRQPIPYLRDHAEASWLEQHRYFQHIGIYGFKRSVLEQLTRLAPSALEKAEGLEQLRWLENGYKIHVGITRMAALSVDTPEDLEAVRVFLKQEKTNTKH